MCKANYFNGITRSLLLEAASLDVQRFTQSGEYLSNVDVPSCCHGRSPSEIHWLTSNWHCKPTHIKRFFYEYRLIQRKKWNYEKLSSKLASWKEARISESDLVPNIDSRIKDLASCHKEETNQLSAVTKLSFFLNPEVSFFIFDRFANIGVRNRIERGTNEERIRSGYKNNNFQAFMDGVQKVFDHEYQQDDFLSKMEECLASYKVSIEIEALPFTEKFVARRLLDKLVLYEGHLLSSFNIEDQIKKLRNDLRQ